MLQLRGLWLSRFNHFKSNGFAAGVLNFLFLIMLVLGSGWIDWSYWDFRLVDGWQKLRALWFEHVRPRECDEIVLVWVNSDTLARLPDGVLTAQIWQQWFIRVSQAQPKIIWILKDPSEDPHLREFLLQAPESVAAYSPILDEKTRRMNLGLLADKTWMAVKTVDKALFAKDGVSRRGLMTFQEQPSGYLKVLEKLAREPDLSQWFTLFESRQIWLTYEPLSYWKKKIPFQDILWRTPLDWLSDVQNRVVMVIFDLGLSLKDYVKTPLEYREGIIPEGIFHATVLDNLMGNKNWVWGSVWVPRVVLWFGSLGLLGFGIWLGLLAQVILVFLFVGLVLVLQFLIFAPLGVFWPWSQVFFVVLGGLYLQLPVRLYVEKQKLKQTQKEHENLKQMEALKTAFFSLMSHNIKTPLSRLSAMLELLEARSLNPETQAIWDFIHLSLKELMQVSELAINYLKVESHNLRLQRRWINSVDFLNELIHRFEPLAQSHGVRLEVLTCDYFEIWVDVEILWQALGNIIENAIKYNHPGGWVRLSLTLDKSFLCWTCQDSGYGIDPEDQKRIFQKFYRGEDAQKRGVKGTGLGLYLAKYIVELHAGQIILESSKENGTLVKVILPVP